MNSFDNDFWEILDDLVNDSEIVIDRPKGTAHPRYPNFIYKVDYGYIKNTSCIVDFMKRDSEIKVLIGCTEEEKQLIYQTHNETQYMKGIMIRR